MDNSVTQNQQAVSVENMQIRMPASFESGGEYIPIGKQTNVNGQDIPAIPNFTTRAPASGTYVLGSINGSIQWIATENCDA
jgi:hypothetical protein